MFTFVLAVNIKGNLTGSCHNEHCKIASNLICPAPFRLITSRKKNKAIRC